jgi:hypothetical protein
MNQGPPCPNCGSLLRWYSDPQKWGCDTCRVMFPPQVMVHPQDYATGAPRHARGTPAKKWRPIPLVIAALLLVGAATAVTFRIFHERAPHVADLGGYADRETAVRETFRALAAGDLAGLVAKAGDGLTRMIVTCDDSHEPSAADEQQARAAVRDELSHAIDHAKGTSFSVATIEEPAPAKVIAKGEAMSRGCKLTQPFTSHTLAVKLELARNGKPFASEATLVVTEVEGRFFVSSAPKLGGCDAAIAQLVTLQAEAAKVEAPLVAACSDDAWAAKVVECLTHALQLVPDVKSCLGDLDGKQLAQVRTAIASVPALGVIAPEAAAPRPDATLGPAEQLGIADFWVAPRSDGAFVVTSPLVTATFPSKPTAKVMPSARPNVGGKRFDLYTISAGPGYELELIAMGRNLRDRAVLAATASELASHGSVTQVERTDGNQPVTRFSVKGTGIELVVDAQLDTARGLFARSSASGTPSPTSEAFLASVHLREAPDAVEDPATLGGIRARTGPATQKAGRFVLHDQTDSFTIDVPAKPELKRTVDPTAHAVVVTATSSQKHARYVLTISELSAWDALAIGPLKLAELQRKNTKAIAIWNPFQHRLFRLVCTDTPCDVIAKSVHFADPVRP